ncbi:acyl-ACP--UDP-N-acetylglucosamine O-acyltransferase [Blastopirellula marina]|uniref:Acyl-[acyl-carrier-protein]--UDP-N-acetylglucosamine O-acyltransferase n=1 Tax=Blastopirellula marina DSM 3645 TaxID=314230 RepID=A3ZYE9_9BACT|nr:acyl-ACP--UDP-N-acetylglucosamine O-acyltransferase [Blastopirellula marina]EAQ78397.1 acyl-[acyl-carrier-protein]--UDP-N-acetylglucosamine O-acyltransferase [Blastopirellula marina DSM 3645]
MTEIHPTAVVSPQARLGADVQIGPFCVIEAGVEVGDRCRLESFVTIKSGSIVGCDNRICDHAVIGGAAQHIRAPELSGRLVIGDRNQIREFVTIHRALNAGETTTVGNDCLLMVQAHIGHDSIIGNNVILTNNSLVAGHVVIEDRAYVSGAVAIHQFCRVGRFAMVGGQAHVVQDVPPYVTVDGCSSLVVGLNLVGLKRNGFDAEAIRELKKAYRILYRSNLTNGESLERIRMEFAGRAAEHFHTFLAPSKRGFIQARSRGHQRPINDPVKLRVMPGDQTDQNENVKVRQAG